MGGHRHHAAALAHPHRTLIAAFVAWKALLFVIAIAACIGSAYDTSGALAVLGVDSDSLSVQALDASKPSGVVGTLLTRFASWDAVYYVSVAHRGYQFEQEWAFGAGLPMAIRGIIKGIYLHLHLHISNPEFSARFSGNPVI